jgi:hypothetical protein
MLILKRLVEEELLLGKVAVRKLIRDWSLCLAPEVHRCLILLTWRRSRGSWWMDGQLRWVQALNVDELHRRRRIAALRAYHARICGWSRSCLLLAGLSAQRGRGKRDALVHTLPLLSPKLGLVVFPPQSRLCPSPQKTISRTLFQPLSMGLGDVGPVLHKRKFRKKSFQTAGLTRPGCRLLCRHHSRDATVAGAGVPVQVAAPIVRQRHAQVGSGEGHAWLHHIPPDGPTAVADTAVDFACFAHGV